MIYGPGAQLTQRQSIYFSMHTGFAISRGVHVSLYVIGPYNYSPKFERPLICMILVLHRRAAIARPPHAWVHPAGFPDRLAGCGTHYTGIGTDVAGRRSHVEDHDTRINKHN